MLVAGKGVEAVAKQAAQTAGVSKVLVADDAVSHDARFRSDGHVGDGELSGGGVVWAGVREGPGGEREPGGGGGGQGGRCVMVEGRGGLGVTMELKVMARLG